MFMNTIRLFTAAALSLAASIASAQTAGPNDAQIAAIVVTANQVDIDAGKLAASKSGNKEVNAFAQRSVTDHTVVNHSATELMTRLKVKPEDNATSTSRKKGGDELL